MREGFQMHWRKALRKLARGFAPAILLVGVSAWLGFGALGQDASEKKTTTKLFGVYDIDELKRMLDVAREAGFSEAQVQQITVEDDEGHTINAYKVIQDIERRQREQAARLAAEQARVYLTPNDVFRELDGKQKKDTTRLRENILFE